MAVSTGKSGRVVYGERAFEQDAGHAIRGDVVRALLELITNADDAYAGAPGDITLRIEKTGDEERPVSVSVEDAARGLDAEGLQKNFAVLGGKKEDAHDAVHARGLLGRGAKDVASLGSVTFSAIFNGGYSSLSLNKKGEWQFTAEDLPANEADYESLHLDAGQNGLVARLLVEKKFKVQSRNQLQEQLSKHAQLRELLTRRTVRLQDLRETPYLGVLEPPVALGETVLDSDLTIEGYSQPVKIRIRRLPARDSQSVSPFSAQGLLVKSGVTVFENTWFELDSRPESNYFAGEVDAPQIAEIIRAFDKDEELGGPARLLSRNRDGLDREHPYRRALSRAAAKAVLPLFDQLAKSLDADRKQGAELSRAFSVAQAALREQLNEVLNEIDDQAPAGGTSKPVVESLSIIPPRRVAAPGESVTFTVRSLIMQASPCEVDIDSQAPDGVIAGLIADQEPWQKHDRLNAFQSQIHVDAGLIEGSATLRVTVGDFVARASLVVSTPEEEVLEAPTALELNPAKSTVAPGRGKRLTVRAPIDATGSTLDIEYEGVELSEFQPAVILRAEPEGRWAEAVVQCKAGVERGKGKFTIDDPEWGQAQATVSVDESAGRGGFDLTFELSAHKSPSRRVALRSDAGAIKVLIYGHHPSFSGIFGKYLESDSKFGKEDSPEARAVLAEVICSELANHLTERDYAKHPDQLNDGPRVLRRRTDLANRFLPILHKSLKPASE